MSATMIAIPSNAPGGLDASVSVHFGHCDLYTLVELDGDTVQSVTAVPNPPHQEGGCLAPVQLLARRGVKKLLASGMGRRPLMGFQQAGIDVFLAKGFVTIGEALKAFQNSELPQFTLDSVCGGSGGCGNH